MNEVYGPDYLSKTRVKGWSQNFRNGEVSLRDKARPGQARRAITDDTVEKVDAIVQVNRRITA